MKKISLMALTLLLIVTGMVKASELVAEKKAEGITAKISIENDPLIIGDNRVTVDLFDDRRKTIRDAKVEIFYFMPSMPSMKYTSHTERKDKKYFGMIKPTMAGEWTLDVRILNPDGIVNKVTMNFNAK
jgi:hypothetical protein